MLYVISLSLLYATATASILNRDLWQPAVRDLWQPAVGAQWQIVINNNISVNPFGGSIPTAPEIWDIDLFNTPNNVFETLHKQEKKVICYFSAGTGEDWRPDYKDFPEADLGTALGCWPGERYLNLKSSKVWDVIAKRIQLASQKGCDGIDPDNMDVYANVNGFGLTQQDSIDFLNKMAAEARKYGMSTGLKNALEILPKVINQIQFAVNEECQAGGDCSQYSSLIKAGKPVFHIEYVTHSTSPDGQVTLISQDIGGLKGASTQTIREVLCVEKSVPEAAAAPVGQAANLSSKDFSTVIKGLLLDGWVYYCDGTNYTTPDFNVGTGGPTSGYCGKSRGVSIAKAKAKGISGL